MDPLAEKFPSWSPYAYTLDNPVNLIDPDGRSPLTDYKLLKNGKVERVDINDDSDKNSYDRLYATTAGKINKSKFIDISKTNPDSKSIISDLSVIRNNTKERYGTTTNGIDARRIFQFGADNSNVEWSIGGFDTKGGGRISYADTYLVGNSGIADKVTAPWKFGATNLTFEDLTYSGHTHPYTKMPQPHDVNISKLDIYNFIYYTGAGSSQRENLFVPFNIIKVNGELKASPKLNQRQQVKLPDLIK